jgi:hypothetical protein
MYIKNLPKNSFFLSLILLIIIVVTGSCNQFPFGKEKIGLDQVSVYIYGNLKSNEEESFFYFSKNGKPFNGIIESYYPDKTLRYQLEIKDGLMDGKAVYYNTNKTIRWKTGFTHGIKSGECESNNESGENHVISSLEIKTEQVEYVNQHLNEVVPLSGIYSDSFELILENSQAFFKIGLSGEGKKPNYESTQEATATSEADI